MYKTIQLLFDIPGFIYRNFGSHHPVFDKLSPKGNETINVAQYIEKSNAFSSYLLQNGIQKGNRVVSILHNSAESNFIEIGILQVGGVHVPLSALYAEEQLKNILLLIQPVLVFTSSASIAKKVEATVRALSLSVAVVNIRVENVFVSPETNPSLDEQKSKISPDDTACILFTSGSAAHPKGVVLSHKNILTSVKDFAATDIFAGCKRSISILPLSLSGERKVNYSCQLNGITVSYPQSSKNILNNLLSSQADITAMVPYLLMELNEQIIQAGEQFLLLKSIICGGASASQELLHSFALRGINVFEVYGLTETASLFSYNTHQFQKYGTAGKIAPVLAHSFSENNEVLVKGDCVMKGYLQTDDFIDTARDEEGWLHTGDSGYIDEEGFLHITGRIKSAFKNSRGAFVYPEQIESTLLRNPVFSYLIITGENADSLTAIIQLKDAASDSEDSNTKVRDIIRSYNSSKSDDMKITKYLIWNESLPAMFNSVSMKAERNKIAEKVKSDSLFHFIAVD